MLALQIFHWLNQLDAKNHLMHETWKNTQCQPLAFAKYL